MHRREKLTTETIDPVPRLTQKCGFITFVLPRHCPGIFGDVRSLLRLEIVINCRIEAAVEVRIGSDEEMVGKDASRVAHGHLPQVCRPGAAPLPGPKRPAGIRS